jgi:uncharacterized protein YdeI (YjbR/CyaY-like superfamily)
MDLGALRVTPSSPTEWREWLSDNHETSGGVWLVYWKKGSGKPSLTWSEAVDEALCFGWIDSKITPLDDVSYEQWFTRRKPKSVWSRVNQDKIARLSQAGLLAPAGQAAVDRAKENGSWQALMASFDGTPTPELVVALRAAGPQAEANFADFPVGWKRVLLEKLAMAKQDATKQKRIAEIIDYALRNQRGLNRKPPS